MEPDPKQLVDATRKGDEAAGAQLVELLYQRIFAFLRRLAGNDADAADLTQRTFSRMWQALPSFAERSSVASWVHSIAYHLYADWLRADRRNESRPAEWWEDCPAPGPLPNELASQTDLAGCLYSAVDKLEEDLRHTVHLHYYQELTLQETADAMGVATSTVKYRLRLALKELQKQLLNEPLPLRAERRSNTL